MPLHHDAATFLCSAAAGLMLSACAGTASRAPSATTMPQTPLALSCLTCHAGPDADRHAVDLGTLAPDEIERALREFGDGTREGTVMPRLARGLDADEITRLAHAFGQTSR